MYKISNLKLAFASLPDIKKYPIETIVIRVKTFNYRFEKSEKEWSLMMNP